MGDLRGEGGELGLVAEHRVEIRGGEGPGEEEALSAVGTKFP